MGRDGEDRFGHGAWFEDRERDETADDRSAETWSWRRSARVPRDHDLAEDVTRSVLFAGEAYYNALKAKDSGVNVERTQVVLDLCLDRVTTGEIQWVSERLKAPLDPLIAQKEERERRLRFRHELLSMSAGRRFKSLTQEETAWIANARDDEVKRVALEASVRERMGWADDGGRVRSR